MSFLTKLKIALLAILTLGGSIAVAKYKSVKRENQKLQGENDVLREELTHEKRAKSAANNYAKMREKQYFQERKKREELTKLKETDEEVRDFLDTPVPDSLRENGL